MNTKAIILFSFLQFGAVSFSFAQNASSADSTTRSHTARQDSSVTPAAQRTTPATTNNVSTGTPNVLINNAGFTSGGVKTSGFVSNGSSVQPVIVHPGPNILPAGFP
jgi:hypothetical protein